VIKSDVWEGGANTCANRHSLDSLV